MADSPERPAKAKKFKGSFQYKKKYNTTWSSQEKLKNYKDMITNSKLGDFHFYCKICTKFCSYGGVGDLVRHCNSVTHQKMEKERRAQTSIACFACIKNSPTDILT